MKIRSSSTRPPNPFAGVTAGAGTRRQGGPPPPQPKGPGISLAELVGGAVRAVKQAGQRWAEAEKARQARDRAAMKKLAEQTQDTFERVAFTRVGFDPRTQVDYRPGRADAHADSQGFRVEVQLPKLSVKDLPNFVVTPPEQ